MSSKVVEIESYLYNNSELVCVCFSAKIYFYLVIFLLCKTLFSVNFSTYLVQICYVINVISTLKKNLTRSVIFYSIRALTIHRLYAMSVTESS